MTWEHFIHMIWPYMVNNRLRGVLAAWSLTNRPFQPIWGPKKFSEFFEKNQVSDFSEISKNRVFRKNFFPDFFRNFFAYFSDFPNIFRAFRNSEFISGLGSDSQGVFHPEKSGKKIIFWKPDCSKFQRNLKLDFFKNFWKFFWAPNWLKRTISKAPGG